MAYAENITYSDLGYPWKDAVTLNQSTYDWGYSICPTDDSGCMSPFSYMLRGVKYGETDPWKYYLRNCTSYMAWKLSTLGVDASGLGNGGEWYGNSPASGQASSPKPWDAAVVPATYNAQRVETNPGHVAFIESVNSDGTITVSEYNHDRMGDGDTRTGKASDMGFTEFVDFGVHPPSQPSIIQASASIENSGGSAASWGSNRLDVFAEGTNSTGPNLNHEWFNGQWHSWEPIAGAGADQTRITSQPAAVSWGPNRIDIFARGVSGDLLHMFYDGQWHNWESLGGCIVGAPTVSSWGSGRLDVFAQGCNTTGTNLYHLWYQGQWSNWEWVPGFTARIASSPSAVSWGPNRIDIFARGEGGDVLHDWFGGQWGQSESFGGCIVGSPVVASWGQARLDVFAQGCNTTGSNVFHKWLDNGPWQPWETVPNSGAVSISAVLGAVSWGPGRIDIFARSGSGDLLHDWSGGQWGSWESLGGSLQ